MTKLVMTQAQSLALLNVTNFAEYVLSNMGENMSADEEAVLRSDLKILEDMHRNSTVRQPRLSGAMPASGSHRSYDERHGGPFDRGRADSYYGRLAIPHYYVGGTGNSELVKYENMTAADIEAYNAGYQENEEAGNKKDWN